MDIFKCDNCGNESVPQISGNYKDGDLCECGGIYKPLPTESTLFVEEAALELDKILGDYIDMTEIKKPGTYSKTIRKWIANILNKGRGESQ